MYVWIQISGFRNLKKIFFVPCLHWKRMFSNFTDNHLLVIFCLVHKMNSPLSLKFKNSMKQLPMTIIMSCQSGYKYSIELLTIVVFMLFYMFV